VQLQGDNIERGKMKETKTIFSLFILAFTLAILINPASAGINITDAEAVYEANLLSVSIPTTPVPPITPFTFNIEAILEKELYSVNIPTQRIPVKEIFIVNEEAAFNTSLYSVSIPTQPFSIKEVFIHLEEARAYNELIFPKGLMNDVTPPVITNITVTNTTGNSATIKWNTDEIADSMVKYGKASGVYTESKSDLLFVMNHSIELTGLLPGTTYYFVVSSTDRSGNSNESSERTFTMAPSVTNPSANQSDIPDDTDNIPLWGETARLNVTVTDESGIASVTVDLSEIGGSAAKPMINIVGNIYSTTTNASAGTPPKLYNLTVNATDTFGNSNTSVAIQLKIMKNGDTTGNEVVNIGDALRLANNVSYPGNPAYALSSIYAAEVTGNGAINIGDALRLANSVSYPGNPAYILR
jgi:hypothetical protein